MTVEQIASLGPSLGKFLACFKCCFLNRNTFAHLGAYCRGLLSDLARKSVEPIALSAGTAVRTLQEFLASHVWDDQRMREEIQRRIVREHLPPPGGKPVNGIGAVGWIDEMSVAKKGDKTPGVQRQYCGASGKIDNSASSPSIWPAGVGSSPPSWTTICSFPSRPGTPDPRRPNAARKPTFPNR